MPVPTARKIACVAALGHAAGRFAQDRAGAVVVDRDPDPLPRVFLDQAPERVAIPSGDVGGPDRPVAVAVDARDRDAHGADRVALFPGVGSEFGNLVGDEPPDVVARASFEGPLRPVYNVAAVREEGGRQLRAAEVETDHRHPDLLRVRDADPLPRERLSLRPDETRPLARGAAGRGASFTLPG